MQDLKLEVLYSPSKWTKRLLKDVVRTHIEVTAQVSEAVRNQIPFEKDVTYGSRSKQKMDIYGKDTIPKDAPVFVYLHGGYWQDLDKMISSYCVTPLWQSGIRVIVPDYDLTPSVTLEVIVEEIKELGIFVLQTAKENGCKSVWFGGHSTGAHLTATLLGSDWLNQLDADLKEIFQGVVLISGIYHLTPLINTSINDAVGLTCDTSLSNSPIFDNGRIIISPRFKALVAIAENDSPAFHEQHAQYIKFLKEKNIDAESMMISKMDHFDVVENLCDSSYILTEKIIKLILESNS